MMNGKRSFLFFVTVLLTLSVIGKQQGMTVSPEILIAGDNVRVAYDSKGGVLENEKNIFALVYVYEDYRWRIYDMSLDRVEDNQWEGSFSIPQSAGFIAFKFQNTISRYAEKVDNNSNKGFLYQVYDKDRILMSGAAIGKATFLTPSVMSSPGYLGIFGYFDSEYEIKDRELLRNLIDTEIRNYPNERHRYFYEEVNLYHAVYGADATPYIKETLNKIEKQRYLDEDALFNLSYSYLFLLNDKERSNQIDLMMLKRFPKGRLARRKAMEIPYTVKGNDYLLKTMQVREDFPVREYYEKPDFQGFLYSNFYRRLSQELFDAGKYDQLTVVLKEMNAGMIEDAFNHQPKQYMKFPDRDPNKYFHIAMKYIEELQVKLDFHGNTDGVSESFLQAKTQHSQTLNSFRTVMTELALRTGHYQVGIEQMDAIPSDERFYYNPQGNEAYVRCLENLARTSDVPAALTASASHGKMTPYLMDKMKSFYESLKIKPTCSFDEYLYSLKTVEAKEEILKTVRKGMVSEAYPPFSIEDIYGGRVSSLDFSKDDIVVLDFWAMWCAPCCAALVGMQMAVEKYLDDPHVKFYFVDTQDRATKEQLKKYWKEKGYHDMLIVFDEDSPDTKDDDSLYRSFFPGSSGIPQKAILKDGKVRYRASGYMGSPSGLADELSAVIDVLKNE